MKREMPSYVYKLILLVLFVISTFYFIYNIFLFQNIKNILRYLIIIVLIIFSIIVLRFMSVKRITFSRGIILCSYFLVLIIGGTSMHKIYLKIDKMSTSYNIVASSLIKLKDNNKTDNLSYGVVENDLVSFEELQRNSIVVGEVVTINNYASLISSLYAGDVDYIYIPSNYVQMFKEIDGFNNIEKDTEVIYTKYDKEIIESKSIDFSKEPFSILLMGVDSSENDMLNSSFNGDALLLITFNPNNFNATILSIPRDTYTSITCFDDERKNKITHAAWYGEDCMKNSLEKMFDMEIDYFVKINFKGFVSLIDLLGGIDVDVPIYFCEQDSNRSFEHQICLDKGLQHLNGEQALALARHRKTINDFIRGDNQKLIMTAMMEKVKQIDSINTIYKILDTISNNLITNIKTEDILSLFNVVQNLKNNNFKIYTLKLDGEEEYIYDYSFKNEEGMRMLLYNFIPYVDSINYLSKAMKENLNNEDITTDYVNSYATNLSLLPDFIGKMESQAVSFCEKNNIELKINYVVSNNSEDYIGEILSQSMPAYMDMDYLGDTMEIEVVEKVEKEEVENKKVNCSKKENKDNRLCMLPNFIGKDYDEFQKWLKNNNYSFIVAYEKIDKKDKNYDENKKGIIISQNYQNMSIYDILGKKLKISYIEK